MPCGGRRGRMLQLVRSASAGLQTEEQRSAVAPLQIAVEFQNRQQLHRIDPQLRQLARRIPWHREKVPAVGRRISQRADVQLVDDQVLDAVGWRLPRSVFVGPEFSRRDQGLFRRQRYR